MTPRTRRGAAGVTAGNRQTLRRGPGLAHSGRAGQRQPARTGVDEHPAKLCAFVLPTHQRPGVIINMALAHPNGLRDVPGDVAQNNFYTNVYCDVDGAAWRQNFRRRAVIGNCRYGPHNSPQVMVRPPSTTTVCPVTYPAAGEANHTAVAASSAGSPKRPRTSRRVW